MADDLYAQFGVSPKDYFIDPETNTIKRKELALPTIPELPDNRLIDDFQVSAGSKIGNKLFGTGGEERYQTWPERMVRSGSTIAGDVFSGAVPITDDSGHTSQPVIERVQDMAGLAGMSTIGIKPGTASVGSGMTRQEKPTTFYRGTNLGDERRIKTGNNLWDNNLFVSSSEDSAKMYGSNIQKYEANPDAKILYEGTKEFVDTAGKWRKDESMLDFASRASEAAKAAGYDAVHFKRQGDIGTPIFNSDKFTLLEDSKAATAIGALNQSGMYSNLERTIAGSKVQKATPEQWTSYLKNQPGVKPEELEFSLQGLGDKPLTKEQLAQYVADNGIKFGEVWKGGDKRPTQYSVSSTGGNISNAPPRMDFATQAEANTELARRQSNVPNSYHSMAELPTGESRPKYEGYQLPGGENYRELLMTVPEARQMDPKTGRNLKADQIYKSSHWDEPNVLAHIRMNDREVPGVGKTLHVEEIQSDWHQAGRKGGYKDPQVEKKIKDNYNQTEKVKKELWDKSAGIDEIEAALKPLQDERAQLLASATHSVPNAPFKKTWDELALKRVLSEAATKGYDAVSWTPGEAQAARYDLSKHVDKVNLVPDSSGQFRIDAFKDNKKIIEQYAKTEQEVAAIVGKEVAEKLFNTRNNLGASTVAGQDLKIGGEGIKAFYDTMLPAKANALIKKMGGKVEYHEMDTRPPNGSGGGEKRAKIPIIKITPQMRETIANRGFPLYSSGIPTFTPVDDPFKKKYKLVPVQGNPFQ